MESGSTNNTGLAGKGVCVCATLCIITLPTLRGGTEDALEDILGESNEMLLWATRESVRERARESK